VRIYDTPWNEIAKSDWPCAGEIYVSRATGQETSAVGPDGYCVAVMGDGTLEGDTVRRGLFWTKEDALEFGALLAGGEETRLYAVKKKHDDRARWYAFDAGVFIPTLIGSRCVTGVQAHAALIAKKHGGTVVEFVPASALSDYEEGPR